MANVKWIKITVDMFDDEKIKIIQSMPEGDTLLVVWIKLITLAGKTNDGGYVYISESMPYTDEMLSIIMNKPLNTIRLALSTFANLGMIENDEKGIYLLNFEKHQSLDKLEKIKEQTRLRVQRHRENKKLSSGIIYCSYCGNSATGVDHIIPTSKGGNDEEYNKVPCCIECNRKKNNQDIIEFLNWNRDIINDDLIEKNEKLSKFVKLDKTTNKYINCNVTDCYNVTQSNDTDIDKEEDKDIDKNNKRKKESNYDKIINSKIEDEEVKNAIYEFIKMRKLIKKPMTDRALTMLINKLNRLSTNKEVQIKILEQSILKNWSDIYEYKEDVSNNNKRKEIVPDWMNKETKAEPLSKAEEAEMNELLKEFKDPKLEQRVEALKERLKS